MSTQSEGFVHSNIALVAIGEGKGHGCSKRGMLVDPEFVLAEHLMRHGCKTPFVSKHYGISIKAAARGLFSLVQELLYLSQLFHAADVVLLKVHHLGKQFLVWERGGGKGSCGKLDGQVRGSYALTGLNGLKAGLSEPLAGLVGLGMGRSEGETVDIAATALTEDGDDVIAENFADPFRRRSRKVCAGQVAGVRNDDRMSCVLEKHGDGFPCSSAVCHQNVDPWNDRALAVDTHEDMTVLPVSDPSVEADLHVSSSGSQGNPLSPFPGRGDDRDNGIVGRVVPPGSCVIGYGGPPAGSQRSGGVGVTEVEECMLYSALSSNFRP